MPSRLPTAPRWLLATFLAVAAWALAVPSASAETIAVHDFDLTTVEARLVYVDFWASWCPPCKASFPWMQQLSERFAADGLRVVAVNLDRQRTAAERFIDELEPSFDIVMDPEASLARAFGITTMPTSFLVTPDGTRLLKHSGFRLSDRAALEAQIRQALADHAP